LEKDELPSKVLKYVGTYITCWQRPLEQKPTLAYEMFETHNVKMKVD
jgi:hypothetical protein